MPERLVDVERQGLEVLHTFPVTLSPPADEGIGKTGRGIGRLKVADRACPRRY